MFFYVRPYGFEINKNRYQIIISTSAFFRNLSASRACPTTIRTQQSVLVNSSLIHTNRYTTNVEIRRLVSSDAIFLVQLVFRELGDTIVCLCRQRCRASTSRNYGDCLDFSALPAFSRHRTECTKEERKTGRKKSRREKERESEQRLRSAAAETVFTLITEEAR